MRYTVILSIFLCLILGLPAKAEVWQTLEVARRYDMFWGGVRVGYMAAEIRHNKKGVYRFEVRIKSKGLLDWVSKYQSTTIAKFRFENGDVVPISFFSDGYLRGKHSSTLLEYDRKGNIVTEQISPPKRLWKHKPVPKHLLKSAQNPLTGAVESRERIKNFIEKEYEKGRFNIPIYDGKRLGDYYFTVLGNSTITVKGADINVFGMRFTRLAVAGFSDSEIRKLKEEPVIHVYFLKDQSLLPIKAEAKVPVGGSAVVLYDRDCDSIEECLDVNQR